MLRRVLEIMKRRRGLSLSISSLKLLGLLADTYFIVSLMLFLFFKYDSLLHFNLSPRKAEPFQFRPRRVSRTLSLPIRVWVIRTQPPSWALFNYTSHSLSAGRSFIRCRQQTTRPCALAFGRPPGRPIRLSRDELHVGRPTPTNWEKGFCSFTFSVNNPDFGLGS